MLGHILARSASESQYWCFKKRKKKLTHRIHKIHRMHRIHRIRRILGIPRIHRIHRTHRIHWMHKIHRIRACYTSGTEIHEVPRLPHLWDRDPRSTTLAAPLGLGSTKYHAVHASGTRIHEPPRLRTENRGSGEAQGVWNQGRCMVLSCFLGATNTTVSNDFKQFKI